MIDTRYRRVGETIDRLHEAPDRTTLEIVIEESVECTVSHCTFEESLKEKAGCRFSHAHERIHDLFVGLSWTPRGGRGGGRRGVPGSAGVVRTRRPWPAPQRRRLAVPLREARPQQGRSHRRGPRQSVDRPWHSAGATSVRAAAAAARWHTSSFSVP
ncbi:hypothetical protein ACFS3C_07255 [Azotobacter vinelandii]